jgi:hypothetical protein
MGSPTGQSVTRKVYRLRSLPYAKICVWVAAIVYSFGLAELVVQAFHLNVDTDISRLVFLGTGSSLLAACGCIVKLPGSRDEFGSVCLLTALFIVIGTILAVVVAWSYRT